LICKLAFSFVFGELSDLAARPEQRAGEKGAAQNNADDVPNIEVLDRAYEEKTKHKRSDCSARVSAKSLRTTAELILIAAGLKRNRGI